MCISLMVDTCVRISSNVYNNAELCGPLVSVGTVGTSYTIGGTNLGNVCPTTAPTSAPTVTTNLLEDRGEYQACLASPSTCTGLCAPPSSPLKGCSTSQRRYARKVGAKKREWCTEQTVRVHRG